MAAVWTDMLVQFKKSDYVPDRTIKMTLTCGEETTFAFNGAQWLTQNKPELIATEFAINEGGGDTDGHGKVVSQSMQVGEKAVQNFRIEATNPGGHSSIPVRENAIYQLTDTTSPSLVHTAATGSKNHGARNKTLGKIFPWRTGDTDYVDRRDRWHLPRSH